MLEGRGDPKAMAAFWTGSELTVTVKLKSHCCMGVNGSCSFSEPVSSETVDSNLYFSFSPEHREEVCRRGCGGRRGRAGAQQSIPAPKPTVLLSSAVPFGKPGVFFSVKRELGFELSVTLPRLPELAGWSE